MLATATEIVHTEDKFMFRVRKGELAKMSFKTLSVIRQVIYDNSNGRHILSILSTAIYLCILIPTPVKR